MILELFDVISKELGGPPTRKTPPSATRHLMREKNGKTPPQATVLAALFVAIKEIEFDEFGAKQSFRMRIITNHHLAI